MSKIIFEFNMPEDKESFELFNQVLSQDSRKSIIDINRIISLIESYRPEYGLSDSAVVNLAENICELVNRNDLHQEELSEEDK